MTFRPYHKWTNKDAAKIEAALEEAADLRKRAQCIVKNLAIELGVSERAVRAFRLRAKQSKPNGVSHEL